MTFPPYLIAFLAFLSPAVASHVLAADLPMIAAEGQPLAASARRVVQALEMIGRRLPEATTAKLRAATDKRDAAAIQAALDPHVLLAVAINPESRVKVLRGPAAAELQQGGYTPVLVKVINESTITKRLRITSPQAGPVYAGVADLSMKRQQQTELGLNQNTAGDKDRFLAVEMLAAPPLTDKL